MVASKENETIDVAQSSGQIDADSVRSSREGPVTVITVDRPMARNAVDGPTARSLHRAFLAFEADKTARVAVLHGEGGHFCAGADLKALSTPDRNPTEPVDAAATNQIGPMGPTRLLLSKPVVAAIEGYAVAGGLELALWCDLRVVARDAIFGVFCRRWGVPLIDGGTVRLPRLIGQSRAMDLILTGRPVDAAEAYAMGLANRVVDSGAAVGAALQLAQELSAFPQTTLRHDRLSVLAQHQYALGEALSNEFEHGMVSLAADSAAGAARFSAGFGRHGSFERGEQ